MADIDLALKELRNTLLSIKFFDVALESCIVLTGSLVATTYFLLPWYYALVPWALYTAHGLNKRVNVNSYHEVEEKVPQLREALQTAADTRKQEGILVKELQLDVLAKMRSIKTSYFLGLGATTKQLLLLTGLAFVVIGLSAFNVNAESTKNFLGKQPFISGAFGGLFAPVDNETLSGRLAEGQAKGRVMKIVKLKGNNSLFGDLQDTSLGDQPLEIQIDPTMSGSNLDDAHEAESKNFRDQEAGSIEAQAQGACTQDCNIPKDQQQIVKSYFEKVGTTQ